MSEICIDEAALAVLREKVKPYMNDRRYSHTLGVERECERLGKLLLPDKVMKLRAAALLHDITKVLSLEKQLNICKTFDIMYGKVELMSPALFHAKTGAEVASRDFPEYVDDEIKSAIRFHTTGREGMTLFEGIVYLADYIEETRTFENCVALREYFGGLLTKGSAADAYNKTMLKSFDMTIGDAVSEGYALDFDTVAARNYFIGIVRGDKQ